MRKTVLFLLALFMTAPAMAVSTVAITCESDGNEVTVSYASDENLIRAFALDITTDNNTINVVEVNDLRTKKVTIEMGSLYTIDADYARDPDAGYNKKPSKSGILLKFRVGGNCHYVVDVNELRGGIVMEDPYESPNISSPLCEGDVVVLQLCTVPDVRGMPPDEAIPILEDAGFIVGILTEECNDTMDDGLVLRTDPPGGTEAECDSSVDIVVSLNPPLPGAASNPTPAADAKCVSQTQVLSWTPGANTATQDVYFGITNPPQYRTTVPVGTTTYDPVPDMNVYTPYYWRIDELNECNEKTTGTVWCFITGPQAGKPCCLNEASPCLGDVTGNTIISVSDLGALVVFISKFGPPYRCITVPGAAACPPCYDINGSGRVDSSDIGVLVTLISGWGSPYSRRCPWPNCP